MSSGVVVRPLFGLVNVFDMGFGVLFERTGRTVKVDEDCTSYYGRSAARSLNDALLDC